MLKRSITTDEIDQTTKEERDKLIVVCGGCLIWACVTRAQFDAKKHHCGKLFLAQTLRSVRTFDSDWGKKELIKIKRKLKK